MKLSEKVLIRIVTYAPLVLIPIVVLVILLMNITVLDSNYNITVENFTKNIIEKKNAILKTKINSLANYIEYKNSLFKENMKSNLQDEAKRIYTLADQIYKSNKDIKSHEEIQELIKNVLNSFNQKNAHLNHVQIMNLDGTLLLAPQYMKNLEHKSLLKYKDIIGKNPTKEEIAVAKKGGGYVLDTFETFGKHKNTQQVLYVKAFNHYNWYFKVTAYYEDKNNNESKNIIKAVKKIQDENDDYIFVVDFDGKILLDQERPEVEGKNIYELHNKDFLTTFSKMLEFVSLNGKGLHKYEWLHPQENKIKLKSAYVAEIKGTNWIVGSGYYDDDVYKIVALQVQEINKAYKEKFNYLATFGGATLLFFILLSYIISLYIKNSFIRYKKEIELKRDELVKSHSELESKVKELNDTQEMLVESEKLASLGALVAGISHEINTPVGIALTGVSNIEYEAKLVDKLYKKEELTEEKLISHIELVKKLSSTIRASLLNAIKLIQSFKHISVDQHSHEKRVINLKDYFDETALSLKNLLKHKKVVIVNNIDAQIELDTYAGVYSQIFSNLIINAIKHAFKDNDTDNKIEVYTVLNKDTLEIHFKDNGKGIDESIKHKIFDPFFTTSRGKGGSGLGLSIIYNLVLKELNGKTSIIDIKNGLHISFTVPLNEH